MDKLPDELLLMIFRYIDDNRERTRLELVCRRWRTIMKEHGWKHLRQITKLRGARWIEPVGERCGASLVECSFVSVNIDTKLLHRIAEHFPTLKHLDFRFCGLKHFDVDMVEPFPEIAARLHSLTLFHAFFDYELDYCFLRHFSHLRHLALNFYGDSNIGSLPSPFSADLRSLYLSSFSESSPGSERLLTIVQRDSPRLVALYLTVTIGYDTEQAQPLLSQISHLKNLRFLHTRFDDDFTDFGLLRSCLNSLTKLLALQLTMLIQQLPDLFRSPTFRGLVHLSLKLHLRHFDNFDPIGLLSTVAPQLRSLCLNIYPYSSDQAHDIGRQVLKIAQNGNLEFLNVPCASFAVLDLVQLIRLCPNLHAIGVQIKPNEQFLQVVDLWQVVADQWRAGTRRHLPLRIWFYGRPDTFSPIIFRLQPAQSATSWQNSFLTLRIVKFGFTPTNHVLNELLRDEVFNDGGGTPSFVTEYYSYC